MFVRRLLILSLTRADSTFSLIFQTFQKKNKNVHSRFDHFNEAGRFWSENIAELFILNVNLNLTASPAVNWILPALFIAFTYTDRDSCLKQIYSTQTLLLFYCHTAASFYQQRAYNPWLSSLQHLFKMIDLSVRSCHVYTPTPNSDLNAHVCVCVRV